MHEELAKWGTTVLTPALKIGICPPLRAGTGRSFWENHSVEIDSPWVTLPAHIEELIGMHQQPSGNHHAAQAARDHANSWNHNTSAAQHLNSIKAHGARANLPTPAPCSQAPPTEPNTYTDGSLSNPRKQEWALGGYGIWYPASPHQPKVSQLQAQYTTSNTDEEGIRMWNTANGKWNSSTRTELAALMVAMLAEGPIHAALDNQTGVEKTAAMIREARTRISKIHDDYVDPHSSERPGNQPEIKAAIEQLCKRSPFRKMWGFQ